MNEFYNVDCISWLAYKEREKVDLNPNTIYNINCFDGFKEIQDKSIDISFTSPPITEKETISINSMTIH